MQGYYRAYSQKTREASRELDERELRVWLALLSFVDCRGLCWPGYRALVDITGLCTDAVRDTLEALTAKNYIEVVRKGAWDNLTQTRLANVYRINGAVTDDPDCVDEQGENDDLILELSSNEDHQHHQVTQPINTTKETQPRTPPPTQDSSNEEVQKLKRNKRKREEKTPTPKGVIPNSPPQVPAVPSRQHYRGPLNEFAEPLAAGDERAAVTVYDRVDHKLTLRLARYLVATYGQARVDWALAHLAKQTDVFNPPGYVRALLERQAVEQADAAAVDPGRDLAASWGA